MSWKGVITNIVVGIGVFIQFVHFVSVCPLANVHTGSDCWRETTVSTQLASWGRGSIQFKRRQDRLSVLAILHTVSVSWCVSRGSFNSPLLLNQIQRGLKGRWERHQPRPWESRWGLPCHRGSFKSCWSSCVYCTSACRWLDRVMSACVYVHVCMYLYMHVCMCIVMVCFV